MEDIWAPGLTWSNLLKNRLVKQKLKVVEAAAAIVSSEDRHGPTGPNFHISDSVLLGLIRLSSVIVCRHTTHSSQSVSACRGRRSLPFLIVERTGGSPNDSLISAFFFCSFNVKLYASI